MSESPKFKITYTLDGKPMKVVKDLVNNNQKHFKPFHHYDNLGINCFTPMDNEGRWMAQIRKGNQWVTDIEGLRMCDRYVSRQEAEIAVFKAAEEVLKRG